jgi:hypothetical protein
MNVLDFYTQARELVLKEGIPEDQEFLKEILLLEAKKTELSITTDLLHDLYANFNLQGKVIGGISFSSELEMENGHLYFASEDVFRIGKNIATSEIIMYNTVSDKIYQILAPNIEIYLKVALIIFEYNLPGWCSEKTYSESDRKNLYKKIEPILEEKYLQYYKESYSS